MDPYFYETLTKFYEEIDKFLPEHKSNPCGNCRTCCTCAVNQGVNLLEYNYIEEYLNRTNSSVKLLQDYKNYIEKKKDRKSGDLLHEICPFYDSSINGCSIYSARPLSCRTFGYFIKEDSLSLIPEDCHLKKSAIIYKDKTFYEILPFVRPFYTLVFKYDNLYGNEGIS